MKLRMLGDTIRLRLSQTEVEQIRSHGRVEQAVHFGPEPASRLHYALVASPDAERMQASFAGSTVTVTVSSSEVERWASSQQVGMTTSQQVGDDRWLEILVEKDFRCLEPRPGEEAYDGFPNPKATC